MKLYVDGALVGTNPQTQAQGYTGYWRVGGDNTWGGNTSNYFAGSIDEVAVYSSRPQRLDRDQLITRRGGGTVPNAAPTAAFTSTTTDLKASFDGTGSTDTDGTIASLQLGLRRRHRRRNRRHPEPHLRCGRDVHRQAHRHRRRRSNHHGHPRRHGHVLTPNVKPTAAFTSTTADLKASFDGTGSTDTDGTIASYSWDFGDNTAAGTGATPNHTYAVGGDVHRQAHRHRRRRSNQHGQPRRHGQCSRQREADRGVHLDHRRPEGLLRRHRLDRHRRHHRLLQLGLRRQHRRRNRRHPEPHLRIGRHATPSSSPSPTTVERPTRSATT